MQKGKQPLQHRCASPACGAAATLRCPTCVKLGVDGASSYFCSQTCFRAAWRAHQRAVHVPALASSGAAAAEPSATAHLQPPPPQLQQQQPMPCFRGFNDYTGALRPWRVTERRTLPERVVRPDYAERGASPSEEAARQSGKIRALQRPEEVAKMRRVCAMAREVLDIAGAAVDVGVTTDELDRVVHEECVKRDAYPSPLRYYGFPKSCCTSVNEVICHGIPDMRPLEDGDIVNIDVTLYHDGYHGDLNETFIVGRPDRRSRVLVKNAYSCMCAGIAKVQPGTFFRDIGGAIERQARRHGHSVVRTYCGHGINTLFHCPPNVPHYTRNKTPGIAKKGVTFTIEPMITAGTWRDTLWPDRWTAVTQDGGRSAQFEESLMVVDGGVEVLTGKSDASPRYFWERPGWDEDDLPR